VRANDGRENKRFTLPNAHTKKERDNMREQETFEVTIENGLGTRFRPVFFCSKPSDSYVGDWENNTADLARQVAREFQRWLES
jgi:hypothetical protein